ncbi:MAG: pantetheine-phosphate adenylyltransferase [Velocimicrobium sp.]
MRIGIYPGSFDPVTLGHIDIIMRSSKLFDKLYIGVLNNSKKHALFSAKDRVEMLKEVTKDIENVEVEEFKGLLVDYAIIKNATAIVRGLRAVTDFEYELQLAQTNHKLQPKVDTVFLTTSVEYSYLSSSIVKEIATYDGDVSKFLTETVKDALCKKLKENNGTR